MTRAPGTSSSRRFFYHRWNLVRFRRWFIALSSILEYPLATYTRERLETGMTDRDLDERLAPLLTGLNPIGGEISESARGARGRWKT